MIRTMTTTMALAALIAQAGALAATQSKAPAPKLMCLEGSGGKFSAGALRRVADQIQQCDHDGRWVASNAVFRDDLVTAYDKGAPPPEARWVDYGLLAFEARVFEEHAAADLSDVCRELAARGALGGFLAHERFYEIGTPEGLAETDAFLQDAAPRD